MYPPIILGSAIQSFVSGYLAARKQPPKISNIDIKKIRQDIREICKEKVCEYCGRINKFVDNCKGCGAPCK